MAVEKKLHKDTLPCDIHKIYAWEFQNATARESATPTSDDVGKVAYQVNDDTLWFLKSHSPLTWLQMPIGASMTADAIQYDGYTGSGGSFEVPAGDINAALDAIIGEIDSVSSDLSSTVSGNSGTDNIGFSGYSSDNLNLNAGNLTTIIQTLLDKIDDATYQARYS